MARPWIAFVQVCQLPGGIRRVGPKRQQQMRLTVEADHSDAVLDAADQCVDERIQVLIVREMTGSGAARLHANGQRQRLPIGVGIEREMLRYAVVGKEKVVRREFKDHLSRLGLHQGRHLHQGRAYGQRSLAGIALLRGYAYGSEAEPKRQGKGRSHNLGLIVGARRLRLRKNSRRRARLQPCRLDTGLMRPLGPEVRTSFGFSRNDPFFRNLFCRGMRIR